MSIPQENHPSLSLKEVFSLYVDAVQKADLQRLFTTVTDKEDFFFISARGVLIDSLKDYYNFHDEWFKTRNWEMSAELIKIFESPSFGYTMALFYYREQDPDTQQITGLDSYFTLLFRRENGLWKVFSDICSPITRFSTNPVEAIRYSTDQEYLFSILKSRRTIRKFKSKSIPKAHLLKILDSVKYAPSAGNQQPWKFLVMQNPETMRKLKTEVLSWYLQRYQEHRTSSPAEIDELKTSLTQTLDKIFSAPLYIVILVDTTVKYPEYTLQDGMFAAAYFMIAARNLGYGTGFYTTFFPESQLKTFLQIPEKYRLICFSPLGEPEVWPEAAPRKPLDEYVVFEAFQEFQE
ncbi:MAG: hypothetical protein EAX86_09235 [Candidatus Heimdallarchaeota archaeon]|nr:hypothetical protein [Candidatus Heimdallarchaeota archaeon]